MNRRRFLTGSTAAVAFLPTVNAAALDIDILQSPVMEMLRSLPDRSAGDGFDFITTRAINNTLQRTVTPENPDMYWDPVGEDYQTIFGIGTSWKDLSGIQDDVSLWKMRTEFYERELTLQTLQSNGWELTDEDLYLLQYKGDDEDRKTLAASLNELNRSITDGEWDWVALPVSDTIVVGASENLVHSIADRAMNHTVMDTVDRHFRNIHYVLRVDTYSMSLLPRQALPVESTQASFISRSWTGDEPIIQSVGLNLESPDRIEPMLEEVRARLQSETSTLNGLRYSDFLKTEGTADYRNNLRIDFVDSTGEWDIRHALLVGDLQMLPLI